MREILLVSDLAGVGKVALSAMIPILSTKEINLSYLPTAVVSNNFAYGDAVVEGLTPFMEQTIKMWQKHQFSFDLVTTGFLLNEAQATLIKSFIASLPKKPMIITDPIMGENGSIYLGMSNDLVKGMQSITEICDLMLPNLTEATLIADHPYPDGAISEEEIELIIDKIRKRGVKSIAITSVEMKSGHAVYGFCDKNQRYFSIPYRHIPVEFGGTGDIFSALMTRQIAKGIELESAVRASVALLSEIIEEEQHKPMGQVAEIAIERYLDRIYFDSE